MRPAELLGMQADFLRRYSDAEENPDQRMLKVQVTAIDRQLTAIETGVPLNGGDLSNTIRAGEYPAMAHAAVQHCVRGAQGGMPIMVSPQMVDLVTWVADDFADTETIDLGIMPSPYGFVWLDKPYISPGATDRVENRPDPDTHIDLIVWCPAPRGPRDRDPHATAFLGFNSALRPDAITTRWNEGASKDGFRPHPYNMCFLSALIQGERVGERDYGPMYCRPMVYSATPEDDDLVDGFGDRVREGQRLMEYATWNGSNMQRWLYALWVVMGQEIADLREEQADRATKRRMARMKLPPAITVITLRRPANPHRHKGDGHVEWQHHWFVRGHPRWQPYGVGKKERKLIWISPHVRGNLDAPLHQSEKVYKVSR
jgi:hypothetical protein